MTPEDRDFFQYAGAVLLSNLPSVVVSTLLFGVTMGLFTAWIHLTIGRGLGTPQRKFIFALMVTTFSLFAVNVLGHVSVVLVQIAGVLVNTETPMEVMYRNIDKYIIITAWTESIQMAINDGIVVWRAWVLYPGQKWARLAPCFLFVGTIGIMLPSMVLTSNSATVKADDIGASYTVAIILPNTTSCLSLATNLVATLLILHKLRVHRNLHGLNFKQRRSMTHAQRILLLLVESGFVFCTLQVIVVVLTFVPVPAPAGSAGELAAFIFIGLFWGTTSIFPFVILLIVQSDTAIADNYGLNLTAMLDSIVNVERASDRSTVDPLANREDPDTTTSVGIADVHVGGDSKVGTSSSSDKPIMTTQSASS